jgi:hypothetical protein
VRKQGKRLAKSWCLTTCLTPTTAIQEGHRRKTLAFGNRCTSRPTGGLPPATVLVKRPLPGASTKVENPRCYPTGRRSGTGSGVIGAGTARETTQSSTKPQPLRH